MMGLLSLTGGPLEHGIPICISMQLKTWSSGSCEVNAELIVKGYMMEYITYAALPQSLLTGVTGVDISIMLDIVSVCCIHADLISTAATSSVRGHLQFCWGLVLHAAAAFHLGPQEQAKSGHVDSHSGALICQSFACFWNICYHPALNLVSLAV